MLSCTDVCPVNRCGAAMHKCMHVGWLRRLQGANRSAIRPVLMWSNLSARIGAYEELQLCESVMLSSLCFVAVMSADAFSCMLWLPLGATVPRVPIEGLFCLYCGVFYIRSAYNGFSMCWCVNQLKRDVQAVN